MRLFPLAATFLLVTATAQAAPGVKALGKQFRRLDANQDQQLTADEFAKLLPTKLKKNNPLAATQEMMFAWFDEDASQGVDLGEWIEGKTADGSTPLDFTDEVQDELDANGNGKIAWKEFKRVFAYYVPSKTARRWHHAFLINESLTISDGASGGSISGGTLIVTTGSWSSGSGITTVSGGTLSLGTDDSQSIGGGTYTAADLNTFFGSPSSLTRP